MKKVKKEEKKKTVLLMDDEPQYLDWLVEFLQDKGYHVVHATTVDVALDLLKKNKYRVVVCDLSVPVSDGLRATISNEMALYGKYPGAYVAHFARNMGQRSRQVVVYSVHDRAEIHELASRIRVQYITKGRPRQFKDEIDGILSYDPTIDKKR
jgi:CheY-like chemotaxis protein